MSRDIEFGVMLGVATNDSDLTVEEQVGAIRRLATVAEERGFDAVDVGDHVSYPVSDGDGYPFSPTGDPPFSETTDLFAAFEVLSHVAALTESVRLGTNTCVAPIRHPVALARHVLTVDALSGGRFDFGVAPGWFEAELEQLGVPFEERGARTDEFLAFFERVREEGVVTFDGEYHTVDETGFHPRPTGDIPVWIGGKSGASIRRLAEFGTGWTTFWDYPEDVRAMRERIDAAWEDYHRDGTPDVALIRPVHVGDADNPDPERLLTGDPADVVSDVATYADAGVTRLNLTFFTEDVDAQVEQLRRVGRDVIPEF